MLELSGISKSYQTYRGAPVRKVLTNLSLLVNQGESMAIVGPSGCGKTTLLNILGALDKADEGTMKFNGDDLLRFEEKELAIYRNESVGFIFQLHHLLPQLTLWENVLLPTLLNKSGDAIDRAEKLLKKVAIWEQRNQKPSELSGGECQRAAVVRALMNKPKLVLADEPTGALDQDNAEILSDLLIDLNKEEGTALIVVTHSQELANKMERVYRLDDGQLQLLK